MHRPFVVLAALREEADAVSRLFGEHGSPKREPLMTSHDMRVGAGDVGVLVRLEGTGRLHAAMATAHAIRAWTPEALFVVGTAGAFVKAGAALGDVLVATEIFDYESQRLGLGPPEIRWRKYEPDAGLLHLAQQIRIPEASELRNNRGHLPKVHFGAMLSGDKVIASPAAIGRLRKLRPPEPHQPVLGVEMEGAGVAFAVAQAPVPFLMVRGVADHANNSKSQQSERWSKVACDSAAWFVREVLLRWVISEGRRSRGNARTH